MPYFSFSLKKKFILTYKVNSEIDINAFAKIKFEFAPDIFVYSAKNDEPAVDTGEKFTSNYGDGLDPVPIEIHIPKTTQIVGAGGVGGDAVSDTTYSDGIKKECSAAMTVVTAQRSTLSSAQVKYCSLPELAGIGPIAKKYLDGGNGPMVGIELKGGIEAGKKFIESLKMFYHVANIGDARSLAIHPASTTHSQLNEKELAASGVTQSYVRLCIGLEHIDDIIEDLNQALNKSSKGNLKAVS